MLKPFFVQPKSWGEAWERGLLLSANLHPGDKKTAEFVLTWEVANTQINRDIWAGVERSWPFGLAYQSSSHFVCSAYMLSVRPRLLRGEVFQYLSFLMDRFISTNWMQPKLHPWTHDTWNLAVEVVRRLDGLRATAKSYELPLFQECSVQSIQTWVASFPCFRALTKQTASDRKLKLVCSERLRLASCTACLQSVSNFAWWWLRKVELGHVQTITCAANRVPC